MIGGDDFKVQNQQRQKVVVARVEEESMIKHSSTNATDNIIRDVASSEEYEEQQRAPTETPQVIQQGIRVHLKENTFSGSSALVYSMWN
mmetsp:Transcript_3656/g.8361  ORF Transcript_3656/g.8361 Transcript_3656/m.8361 type:complete len:89 (-) Transcript_3656:345-611(-)